MDDPIAQQNAIVELRRLQNQVAELAHNNELLRQQLEREREDHRSQTAVLNRLFNPEDVRKERESLIARNKELEAFVVEVSDGRSKFAAAAKSLLP